MTFEQYKAAMVQKNPKLADYKAEVTLTVERLWSLQRQAFDQGEQHGLSRTSRNVPGLGGIFDDLFGR